MEKKTKVLLTIKAAENKAHDIVQEAMEKKDKILQKAAEKSQELERKEIENAVSENRKLLTQAMKKLENVNVDSREARKVREKAKKRVNTAVAVAWKEFEVTFK